MKRDPWFRNRLIRDGIYHAIYERMRVDPSVFIMGEGSHMKVHFDAPAIEKEFGERVITLPISEDANTNFAVGLSLAGIVPIVDVISSDFLYRTMDAICNTVAKENYVDNPRTMIIRSEFMTGGPTTGQRIEALFTHIPGLNVVIPSNPVDACGLMRTALIRKEATIFFEDRMIEDKTTNSKDRYDSTSLPPAIPFGSAKIRRSGNKVTVVSYGLSLRKLDSLFQVFDSQYELIDLRTLYPLDIDTVINSVKKTGALLFVEPDVMHAGVGAEVVASVCEQVKCRVARLGGPRVTIPACRDLQDLLVPSDEQVLTALGALS